MQKFEPARFPRTSPEFYSTLNKRVNQYFADNNIDKHANGTMKFKTAFMLALYIVPFLFIYFAGITNPWIMLGLCVLIGLGMAGIGLSVMHDACHGAYSQNQTVNKILGYTVNFVGANAFTWIIQHNVLHHTYTNVNELDEDISHGGILRMNPHDTWKPVHKFQHIYAWPLYGLMTIVWVFFKDFDRLISYSKRGLVDRVKASKKKEWAILLFSKAFYFTYIIVLPILFLPFSWWQILIGLAVELYVCGFILAIIFQPAHVTPDSTFPLPNEENNTLENNWAIHQLLTTKNFANKSRFFSWYVGGLNFQIEHHLFPTICHVHYKKIAPIVESTAKQFGLPYNHDKTFLKALQSHGKSLKEFSQKAITAPITIRPQVKPIPVTID